MVLQCYFAAVTYSGAGQAELSAINLKQNTQVAQLHTLRHVPPFYGTINKGTHGTLLKQIQGSTQRRQAYRTDELDNSKACPHGGEHSTTSEMQGGCQAT